MGTTKRPISGLEFIKKWAPGPELLRKEFCEDLGEFVGFVTKRHDEAGRKRGIIIAADVASEYDRLSAHPWRVSDCILCKLNMIPKSKLRRTPKARY